MRAGALARLLLPSGTIGVTDPGFGSPSGVAGRIISVSFLRSCVPDSSCMNERRKPYPFDQIEPKWQALWDERRTFHAPNPGDAGLRSDAAEVLRARHVPLPERRGAARRASRGLHRDRHHRALQADARLQRAAPDGLGRVRPARRAICDQDRAASGDHHRARTSPTSRRSSSGSASPTTGSARSTRPIRDYFSWTQWIFLQIYNSWFNPETNRAEPISTYRGRRSRQRPAGLRRRSAGELVPGAGHGAGERGSHRRQERSRRVSGRAAADAAMDAAHHRVRRTADRRTRGPGLAGVDQAAAAQLDRPKRRRGDRVRCSRGGPRVSGGGQRRGYTSASSPPGPTRSTARLTWCSRRNIRWSTRSDDGRAAGCGRSISRPRSRAKRSRAHRPGEGKDRRVHRRIRDQSGQRENASRSGSPTTC